MPYNPTKHVKPCKQFKQIIQSMFKQIIQCEHDFDIKTKARRFQNLKLTGFPCVIRFSNGLFKSQNRVSVVLLSMNSSEAEKYPRIILF